MPYAEHPIFTPPADANSKLWRYLDFAKFVALLQKQGLWFSRADLLGDSFEGSYTMPSTESLRMSLGPDDQRLAELIGPQREAINQRSPAWHHINCWHMAEHESAAMWEIYAGRGKGIAIRSTFSRLVASLQGPDQIFVGVVRYIDYSAGSQDWIPTNNSFWPFLHKRTSFEYEHELRAILTRYPGDDWLGKWAEAPPSAAGTLVTVDVDKLIESVYIAPESTEWFTEVVDETAARYRLRVAPRRSDLDAPAVF